MEICHRLISAKLMGSNQIDREVVAHQWKCMIVASHRESTKYGNMNLCGFQLINFEEILYTWHPNIAGPVIKECMWGPCTG